MSTTTIYDVPVDLNGTALLDRTHQLGEALRYGVVIAACLSPTVMAAYPPELRAELLAAMTEAFGSGSTAGLSGRLTKDDQKNILEKLASYPGGAMAALGAMVEAFGKSGNDNLVAAANNTEAVRWFYAACEVEVREARLDAETAAFVLQVAAMGGMTVDDMEAAARPFSPSQQAASQRDANNLARHAFGEQIPEPVSLVATPAERAEIARQQSPKAVELRKKVAQGKEVAQEQHNISL